MKFDHAISLARYNWPLYLICFASASIGFFAATMTSLPVPVRVVAGCATTVATWYAITSFVAFHMMFDRPEFLSGQWLARCVREAPRTCVQLSVCVEETTLPIQAVFPDTICTNLDLFDDSTMTEPAIARAKQAAESSNSLPAKPATLPLGDDSSELTVLSLAAHEIRDPAMRRSLFTELARITTSHGRLIIAEHLRNLPAALAFGPGLFHFYPRSEWTTLATKAGFRMESEFDITPFIHIFVLEHDEN
jgi:hypothetical protein